VVFVVETVIHVNVLVLMIVGTVYVVMQIAVILMVSVVKVQL